MASIVTYKYIKQNPDIMEYIQRADKTLEAMGYTEHSFAHVTQVAEKAGYILETLGYPERTVELAKIGAIKSAPKINRPWKKSVQQTAEKPPRKV